MLSSPSCCGSTRSTTSWAAATPPSGQPPEHPRPKALPAPTTPPRHLAVWAPAAWHHQLVGGSRSGGGAAAGSVVVSRSRCCAGGTPRPGLPDPAGRARAAPCRCPPGSAGPRPASTVPGPALAHRLGCGSCAGGPAGRSRVRPLRPPAPAPRRAPPVSHRAHRSLRRSRGAGAAVSPEASRNLHPDHRELLPPAREVGQDVYRLARVLDRTLPHGDRLSGARRAVARPARLMCRRVCCEGFECQRRQL